VAPATQSVPASVHQTAGNPNPSAFGIGENSVEVADGEGWINQGAVAYPTRFSPGTDNGDVFQSIGPNSPVELNRLIPLLIALGLAFTGLTLLAVGYGGRYAMRMIESRSIRRF
jgi:hypothetical protein